jgi:adenylosuccinate lyase
MREAAGIIIKDLRKLSGILREQAFRYKNTVCIGRSHGVHAEPMTFGLKFTLWFEEAGRNLERLERARRNISIGKFSGAVGTFSNIPVAIEEKVCKKLGLRPEPIATQVVQRDRHAEYLSTLAILAASIEKIVIEIRHLQRTEVLEAEEPFAKGQKGSSAMPHKRNPVGCENLSGLARVVRSNALAALENVALWHERDISHSSVERVIIPDSTILVDYMLNRLAGILSGLQVYPERMRENLNRSYGLYNSQNVLISLTEKGMTREDAYALVQKNAMMSWKSRKQFKALLSKDREVRKFLSAKELDGIFDLRHYFRNIDYIFRRVFGKA